MSEDSLDKIIQLMEDEKFSEAIPLLDHEIARGTKDPMFHGLKAMSLLELGEDTEAALKEANLAYSMSTNHLFKYVKGWAMAANGEARDGLKLINQAANEDPENTEYLIKLAEIYEDEGQSKDALKAIIRAQKIDPDDVRIGMIKAGLLNANKRPQEAVKELESIIERYPEFDYAYFVQAESYMIMNDLDNARKSIDLAIEHQINPDPEFYERSAQLYALTGNYDKSLEDIDRAANLAASEDELQSYLLQKGKILMMSGNDQGALDLFTTLSSEKPDEAMYLFGLIDVLSDMKRFNDIENMISDRQFTEGLSKMIRAYAGIESLNNADMNSEAFLNSLTTDLKDRPLEWNLLFIIMNAMIMDEDQED